MPFSSKASTSSRSLWNEQGTSCWYVAGFPLYEEMRGWEMSCGKNTTQCMPQRVQGESPLFRTPRWILCFQTERSVCTHLTGCRNRNFYPSSGLQLWFLCVSQTCIRLCCYEKLPVVRLGTEWHEGGGMIHLLRVTAKEIFENLQSERITLLLIA